MRKKLSRKEYKEKFDHLMETEYNYIPQDGERIIQCHEPFPDWWFISNKCYLFSVANKHIKILNDNPSECGLKRKDGTYQETKWRYRYGKNDISTWKLVAEHFCECEFDTDEEIDIHHIKGKTTFNPEDGKKCNRADNLQALPKSVHKDLTHKYGKTIEQLDKESEERAKKAGVESVQMTNEELMRILITGILTNEGTPIVYLSKQADDPKDIECKAHPIKAVVLQE